MYFVDVHDYPHPCLKAGLDSLEGFFYVVKISIHLSFVKEGHFSELHCTADFHLLNARDPLVYEQTLGIYIVIGYKKTLK